MKTASIEFSISNETSDDPIDAIISLLSIWYKNGQIIGDAWHGIQEQDSLRFMVCIPEDDSLDSKNANQWVEQELEKLIEVGIGVPQITVLGTDPADSPCCCKTRESFILYTNFLLTDSPLKCGNCFGVLPLYTIPHIFGGEYLDILRWEADYKACDTLQINCTTGERFAERELREYESSLSKNGREICQKIQESTGLTTYYFLFKIRGRSKKRELERRCPGCGGEWRLEEPLHRIFDFQCERCGLLSNLACDLF